MRPLNFKDWVKKYEMDPFKIWALGTKPVNRLANHIAKDKRFPAANERKVILDYLKGQKLNSEAITAFKNAWGRYRVYKSRLNDSEAS
jgi:uncharacterized protein YozE (UPF0346 family)